MRKQIIRRILTVLDEERPYRVVAPTFQLDTARLQTKEEAVRYFDGVSGMGHQAILSFVDPNSVRVKILAYSPPVKRKGFGNG